MSSGETRGKRIRKESGEEELKTSPGWAQALKDGQSTVAR